MTGTTRTGPARTSGEGLAEPVPRALAATLRRAALDHAQADRRRGRPTLLHVGVPGGAEEVFALRAEDPHDHAVRADVLAAMLRRARRAAGVPLVWLTRTGPLELQDVDAAWLAAARTATGEAGVELTMVVVTRHGWFDPRSGTRREWKRLRDRTPAPASPG